MDGDNQQQQGDQQGDQQQQQGDQQGQQQQQQQQPGPVPYERFKEVNDQLRQMQERLAQIEQDRKAAEEKELKEKEDWKALAEKREAELKIEQVKLLRLKVAGEKGIPPAMAERLRGETEEEMIKDAEALLPLLKPPEGPGVPLKGKGGQAQKFDLESMSPEEIRKHKTAIMAQEGGD